MESNIFSFNYGNKDSITLKNGNNRMIIFKKIGIAVVDDKSDDSIDMYIIFSVGAGSTQPQH
jgi:hypothetical protein